MTKLPIGIGGRNGAVRQHRRRDIAGRLRIARRRRRPRPRAGVRGAPAAAGAGSAQVAAGAFCAIAAAPAPMKPMRLRHCKRGFHCLETPVCGVGADYRSAPRAVTSSKANVVPLWPICIVQASLCCSSVLAMGFIAGVSIDACQRRGDGGLRRHMGGRRWPPDHTCRRRKGVSADGQRGAAAV